MGMYTELMLRCQLERVPEEVFNMLNWMSSSDDLQDDPQLPEHELFKCSRWRSIGWSNSFYFTPLSCFKFQKSPIDEDVYFLIIICDLKNYDNEIDKFIHWLTPYFQDGRHEPIGWKRYEEDDEPTIIYT